MLSSHAEVCGRLPCALWPTIPSCTFAATLLRTFVRLLTDGHGAPLELIRQTKVGNALTTARYWYVLDGRGNVVALTDSSGSVVDRYAYGVWGSLVSASEAVPQRLRYAGYWYDAELGWYWASVRYYSPSIKRWLQPDPSMQDGVRTYVYVGDDPVDATDPGGLSANPCGTILGVLIAACNRTGTSHVIYMLLIGEDLGRIGSPDYDPGHLLLKGVALVDLASNIMLVIPGIGFEARIGTKVATEGAIRIASGTGEHAADAVIVRTIDKGETIHALLRELAERTYLEGLEHAIVRLADGRRAIVQSGASGGMIPNVVRLIVHTHTYDSALRGELAVSHIDRKALQDLGQLSSWLLVHGELIKFGPK